jgi:TetR/AcrR family transcriptional regulator, transcriptional repressor for nem operon
MRRSRKATAESRRAIIETAAQLFMTRGVEGVGVAEIMRAAGMTHGGFYRHFPSKEALLEAAMAHAFDQAASRLGTDQIGPVTNVASAEATLANLSRYVGKYLSFGHVNHADSGCPMAALGTGVPQAGEDVTAVFARGAEEIVTRLTAAMVTLSPQPREAALRLLASLVGTIVIARAVGTESLQGDVIEAVRADPLVSKALGARTTDVTNETAVQIGM